MIQVDHFGVHWDGPVAWLLQGRSGANFVGLGQKCPFQIRGGVCNHMIVPTAPVPDRVHWAAFERLLGDPLVQAMLPIPGAMDRKSFFISDPGDTLPLYLATLSRLSSPIRTPVRPIWVIDRRVEIERELTRTNVQPWIVTQVTQKNQALVDMIAKSADYFPRTVILTGGGDVVVPKNLHRIETKISKTPLADLLTLPLETLGAAVLRKYARKEPLV